MVCLFFYVNMARSPSLFPLVDFERKVKRRKLIFNELRGTLPQLRATFSMLVVIITIFELLFRLTTKQTPNQTYVISFAVISLTFAALALAIGIAQLVVQFLNKWNERRYNKFYENRAKELGINHKEHGYITRVVTSETTNIIFDKNANKQNDDRIVQQTSNRRKKTQIVSSVLITLASVVDLLALIRLLELIRIISKLYQTSHTMHNKATNIELLGYKKIIQVVILESISTILLSIVTCIYIFRFFRFYKNKNSDDIYKRESYHRGKRFKIFGLATKSINALNKLVTVILLIVFFTLGQMSSLSKHELTLYSANKSLLLAILFWSVGSYVLLSILSLFMKISSVRDNYREMIILKLLEPTLVSWVEFIHRDQSYDIDHSILAAQMKQLTDKIAKSTLYPSIAKFIQIHFEIILQSEALECDSIKDQKDTIKNVISICKKSESHFKEKWKMHDSVPDHTTER